MISISTITGLLMAFGILIGAITMSTEKYMLFVSVSSFLIVLGGTLTATLVSYSYPLILSSFKGLLVNLLDEKNVTKFKHASIKRTVEWNQIFRSGGMSGLENSLNETEKKDPFICLGIELIGTGYKGDDLKQLLDESNHSQYKQEMAQAEVLNAMGTYAPGFGMIGTLIGLIVMLDNLNGDMAALGNGLAVALLTTLYGILFAQVFFKPAAIRINRRASNNFDNREMQINAFVLMTEKRPDMYLQDSMNVHLPFKKRLES
ncbi:flagellar motor protein MotA [Aliivibrio finisterrensis]|uniref:motility protein A n=1 Tax=Aliivibrio finisterrensis TaxID=511998 RepID=UPI00102089EF|nr:MotA/TolQ/ExbB proton channel family protein [Aliivibrio finisterrensis]RYU70399.1 flagellar motor protein MotA [Aliivibrio finisterrensis]RYU74261.1 flagellar motor protein MotA [Aliivibrio finisterrensis]RYU76866.1 flagellar motor protein MotA [Aliivibrio finisterrensis]